MHQNADDAARQATLPPHERPENGEQYVLSPEDYPNLDDVITDDGAPMENVFIEKQQRLLVETAYAAPEVIGGGAPFVAMSNVGLFYLAAGPPLVPDILLSRGVRFPEDVFRKQHRSYFLWVYGKRPDVVVEIVSDRRGGEATYKMVEYARIGVNHYVIFDPEDHLGGGVLRAFALRGETYDAIDPGRLGELGFGLTFWQGSYEDLEGRWLRWCDSEGLPLPTAQERSHQAEQRAEQERQRAEQERQRAEQERQRAEAAEQAAERLRAKLRQLGVDPDA